MGKGKTGNEEPDLGILIQLSPSTWFEGVREPMPIG